MLFLALTNFLLCLQFAFQTTGLVIGGKPRNIIRQETGKPLQNIVTWDQDSLFVRGERVAFYSGEFHPYRLPVPDLWLDVFQKIKALGYNGASFYVDWALVEGTEGTINTDGVFALEPFFDAAKEAGIYLLARPGPYINAEVSGGGFPGWLGRIKGTLRTNATDYLSATNLYIQTIGKKIADAQITNGGPVILWQVENEYTDPANGVIFPNLDYFDYVINQALNAGIVVPIVNNDASPQGYFAPGNPEYGNVTVDIYGHDSYPLGFDCSDPTDWPSGNLPTNFHTLHEEQAPYTPYSIIEFQGGSFDPWGGPGFAQCDILISAAFERVFYKNNWSFGVTIYNQYMIYGGTNWGNLGHPGGYTSYDYAAVIAEDRSTAREKYSEAKLQANFLKVTPSYLTSQPANATTETFTNNNALTVTPLFGNGSATNLYIVRHTDYNSYDSTSYKFQVSSSAGKLSIPQLSTYASSLSLNGRDSKVHVTDYNLNGTNLIYSTGEIFTWQKYASGTILILYGDVGETHEFAVPASLGKYQLSGGKVHAQKINNTVVVQWQVTTEQQKLTFEDLTVYLLWRNDAYDWWVLELPAASPVSQFSLPSKQSVIVEGGYLMRTAQISNGDLYLIGEVNKTTEIQVIGAPEYKNLFINGKIYSSKPATISYAAPTLNLPKLSALTWQSIDTLPELSSTYSDRLWPIANHTTTNNPMQKTTPTVLYASDYGFHTGPLVYRGHFTSASTVGNTTLSVSTQGGSAYGYQVFLNSTMVHTFAGNSQSEGDNATIPLSLKAATPYVLTVVIDHTGLTENYNPGADTMKEPRGILSYALSGYNQSAVSWKLTGRLGGESYYDKARGPYNEGGLYFERQGYHLPNAPIYSGGPGWSPVVGGPVTGFAPSSNGSSIRFYATKFALSLPSDSYDAPLAFQFGNSTQADGTPANVRANLYVNGYQFGKYINNIGPQTSYPVPEGILNYQGDNYVGVYLWDLNGGAGRANLGDLQLVSSSTPAFAGQGQRRKIGLSPMDGWVKRMGAY